MGGRLLIWFISSIASRLDFSFFSWEVIYHISNFFSKNDPLTELTEKFCPQKQSILFILLITFCFIIDTWKIMALWVITLTIVMELRVWGAQTLLFLAGLSLGSSRGWAARSVPARSESPPGTRCPLCSRTVCPSTSHTLPPRVPSLHLREGKGGDFEKFRTKKLIMCHIYSSVNVVTDLMIQCKTWWIEWLTSTVFQWKSLFSEWSLYSLQTLQSQLRRNIDQN